VNSEESHGTAGLGVSALGLQTTKPGHRWKQCVTDHWAISRECQAPGTPLLNRGGVPVLFLPQELRSMSTDSELRVLLTRARCLLFDSHVGHTLFPAWADTHT